MSTEAPGSNAADGSGHLLGSSRLFRGIPRETVDQIVGPFQRHGVRPDTVIVREGEAGDSLFIIETGLVEVFLQSATGETTVLARLGAGETFGEMSVLTGEPRSANVRAIAPTVVRLANREAFLQAAATTPLLLFNLSRILVDRLQRTTHSRAARPGAQVIAIIGRMPPLIGSLVATNVAAALSHTTRKRVLLIDRPPEQASSLPGRERSPALSDIWTHGAERLRVPALQFGTARFMALNLPPDAGLLRAIQPLALSEALGWFRQNAAYTVLNLVGEDRRDVLSIMAQLDRIYLLATTAQLGTTYADELVSAFSALRRDVREQSFPVLLSDEGLSLAAVRARSVERLGVPARVILPGPAQILREAARQLPPLAINARHLSFSRAMHWMARDIAGLKVGLALGSGGARGFAHVGALRFLEEHDIPNDYLAGCSMGSVIGAPRALGMDVVQGQETMRMLHQKFTNLLQPRWGMGMMQALFKPEAVESTYRELVGDATFEELPVPFAVVAADLETARPIVFTQGPLADALRASSSIPGVWPPKEIGKMRLVDGAVLNPVPTQAVRDLGADIVIAVDLSNRDAGGAAEVQKQSNLLQNLMRCIDIMTADRAVRDCLLADVVIRPKFEITGWKAFEHADAYAEAGYVAAREMFSSLQKLLPWLDRSPGHD
ncbi:MAG: patatin-like phospholipase family protein [Chloroflexi bacterium]|nr:patatin-like phospholipase family protein [Chloroflexota bacterium]